MKNDLQPNVIAFATDEDVSETSSPERPWSARFAAVA